jgi:hypothetical protein
MTTSHLKSHPRLSIKQENDALYRRIEAVDTLLKQTKLSPWAKKYWNNVLKALQREHKRLVSGAVT